MAVVGDLLWVFECKQTLLPCSSFELRTTWDYVEHAADQLDKFERAWQETSFREQIQHSTGLNVVGLRLATCIVLSHKLLSGGCFREHPIRHVYEVARFVADGTATVLVGQEKRIVRHRADGPMTATAVEAYLDSNNLLHGPIWRSFESQIVTAQFEDAHLTWKRYSFNRLKHLVELELVPLDAVQAIIARHAQYEKEMYDYERGLISESEIMDVHATRANDPDLDEELTQLFHP